MFGTFPRLALPTDPFLQRLLLRSHRRLPSQSPHSVPCVEHGKLYRELSDVRRWTRFRFASLWRWKRHEPRARRGAWRVHLLRRRVLQHGPFLPLLYSSLRKKARAELDDALAVGYFRAGDADRGRRFSRSDE